MTGRRGQPGGSSSTTAMAMVVTVLAALAAGLLGAGAFAVATLARVDGSTRIAWAAVGVFFGVLAVGLLRRWILASVFALLLGGAGAVVALLGLLGVGDSVYDRVQQAPELVFPLLMAVACTLLAVGGVVGVPPMGRVGRRAAGLATIAGLGLAAVGVGWLLEVQEPARPIPGSADVYGDCGSAYSPGSASERYRSGCATALDTARHGGRIAVAVGSTLVLVGGAVLVGQVGWRQSWPFVFLAAGVIALGVVAWFVFLPLDGGRCASVYDGSEGEACASLSGAINRMATIVFFTAPVLLVTGLVGVVLAVVRALDGRGPAAQTSG